ncbi:hypothetical protein AB0A69_27540 [Streptomyces sp. NPDC045431]|uniref:hypothetical protein n=1 Tax=Streptomyces sp. NPDC045431 TaxID=3155613 RepID=UPI0033DE6415
MQRRQKIPHAGTTEAAVVGYTGPASRPRSLAVRLGDGRTVLTQRLLAAFVRAAATPRSAPAVQLGPAAVLGRLLLVLAWQPAWP